MSHRLILRPEAEIDVAEAAEWYELQRAGLSLQFRGALDRTFAGIQERPLLHALAYRKLRRALVRRFPFGVFYVVRSESVIVVAVLHTARNPRVWRARLKLRDG
jgi:plasmid stabilization system protein ParE